MINQLFVDHIFFRSSSAKEKLREESLKYLTKDRMLQLIEEGFETAKTPVYIHLRFSRMTFTLFL